MQKFQIVTHATLALVLLLTVTRATSLPAQVLSTEEETKIVVVVVATDAAVDETEAVMEVLPLVPNELDLKNTKCREIGEHCNLAEHCCTMRCQKYAGKCVS